MGNIYDGIQRPLKVNEASEMKKDRDMIHNRKR